MAEPANRVEAAVARVRGFARSDAAAKGLAKDIERVLDALTVAQGRAALAPPLLPPKPTDHEQVSPVDGSTWVQRNDGWQHVDVLDREVRMRRSSFHGLMIGVDGHWVYVGDAESAMLSYVSGESAPDTIPTRGERESATRPGGLRDHASEAWEDTKAARHIETGTVPLTDGDRR